MQLFSINCTHAVILIDRDPGLLPVRTHEPFENVDSNLKCPVVNAIDVRGFVWLESVCFVCNFMMDDLIKG